MTFAQVRDVGLLTHLEHVVKLETPDGMQTLHGRWKYYIAVRCLSLCSHVPIPEIEFAGQHTL